MVEPVETPWQSTSDVGQFLRVAGGFLSADPVGNNALLTEARFWDWWTGADGSARFGWCVSEGTVCAALVQLPDHPVLSSRLPAAALPGLAQVLDGSAVGVQADDAGTVAAAVPGLVAGAPLSLLRLAAAPPVPQVPGRSRPATGSDLPLLRSWFSEFRRRVPDDPSQVGFVVDHPVLAGAVTVWEVHGRPVAMASRTPVVAGMTRLGLAFQPDDGPAYDEAAFAAACLSGLDSATHVLVLTRDPAPLEGLGFEHVLDRVLLTRGPVHPDRHITRR